MGVDLAIADRTVAGDGNGPRGRGVSGDSGPYQGGKESEDIANVAAALAHEHGDAIDVFAHSIGATFALGAAASAPAAFHRLALYEPPGPATVSGGWADRVSAMLTHGQTGRAAVSFLTEIVGLDPEQVQALRDSPGNVDVLRIVAATIEREARALAKTDLISAAKIVKSPVLLLLGSRSPRWAQEITAASRTPLPQPMSARSQTKDTRLSIKLQT